MAGRRRVEKTGREGNVLKPMLSLSADRRKLIGWVLVYGFSAILKSTVYYFSNSFCEGLKCQSTHALRT